VKPLGICLTLLAVAAFSGKFVFPTCEHSVRSDWQVHFKKLFVHGGNFLHERGGQRFWCCVASWRKRVMERFDGVL